jgi:dTDP-4-amino-4,6-dideoxygalactose transaminase
MKVEFYGHVRQYHNIQKEIDANLKKVLESGAYVMGPMLKQLETELAVYHGTKFAIGVGNGTDAIWLALMALGVGSGDEVITHPNTFFATAEAIWIAGRRRYLSIVVRRQSAFARRRSKRRSHRRPRRLFPCTCMVNART